ncbi:MAG: hypothetical protein DRN61_02535 [Thaumarchaeota archaeon]|nr:MAG: hypothetical protein DRN61_02535 [Nitrososphaerota archaeon]HDD42758.1 hypothetical protein [Nitrososphaeria archaeon]
MVLELASLIGMLLSIAFTLLCLGLYRHLRGDPSYALSRLFLKERSVKAFTLMTLCFLMFAAARVVSFALLILGVSGELELEIISLVRAPIDLLASLLLLASTAILYSVTRRSKRM